MLQTNKIRVCTLKSLLTREQAQDENVGSREAVQHYSTNQFEALRFNSTLVQCLYRNRVTWKYLIRLTTSSMIYVHFKQTNRREIEQALSKWVTSGLFGLCCVYISTADKRGQSFHKHIKLRGSRRGWVTPKCGCLSEMYLSLLNLQQWAGNFSIPGLPSRMAGI